MPGADVASITPLLKDIYLPFIDDLLALQARFWAKCIKSKRDARGGTFKFPAFVGANWGQGSRAENAVLPDAGNQTLVNFSGTCQDFFGRIELTGKSMRRTSGGIDRSYLDGLKMEMQRAVKSLKRTFNRIAYFTKEGILGEISSINGSTVTLKSTGSTGAVQAGRNNGAHYLFGGEGMKVDIVDDGANLISAGSETIHQVGLEITSINRSTNVVTFDVAVDAAVAAGDVLVLHHNEKAAGGTYTTASDGEWDGLLAGVDDAVVRPTYYGIDRTAAANAMTKAVVDKDDSALRSISEGALDRFVQKVLVNADLDQGDGSDYELLMSPGMFLEYKAMLAAQKRFQSPVLYSGSDEKALKHNDVIPVRWERDCPREMIFLLKYADHVEYMEEAPLGWIDLDGSILRRRDSTDNYEGRLVISGNFLWHNINDLGVMRNLIETPVVLRG